MQGAVSVFVCSIKRHDEGGGEAQGGGWGGGQQMSRKQNALADKLRQ